jgi:hypothetical protein
MATPLTTVAPRRGLAIAAATTGLLLALGVTLATLLGWLRAPSLASTSASADRSAPSVSSDVNAAAPQLVLVPVSPASGAAAPQNVLADATLGETVWPLQAEGVNTSGVATARGDDTRANRSEHRSVAQRAGRERDDD